MKSVWFLHSDAPALLPKLRLQSEGLQPRIQERGTQISIKFQKESFSGKRETLPKVWGLC